MTTGSSFESIHTNLRIKQNLKTLVVTDLFSSLETLIKKFV